MMEGGLTSHTFPAKNGTKQGCVMISVLLAIDFSVMLQDILEILLKVCISNLGQKATFSEPEPKSKNNF